VEPFYFLTLVTARRLSILANPEVHQAFITFSHRAAERGIVVGKYVIMPDHIHLFVYFPAEGIRVDSWTQSLKSVLGKKLLRTGIQKPHWQHGFFDHVLRSDESYAEKWQYVEANPVRADLCATPDEWPYQGEIHQIRW
jgi:putative transposase